MSYLKIADGYLNDIASAIQKQLKLSEPMPVTEMAEKYFLFQLMEILGI